MQSAELGRRQADERVAAHAVRLVASVDVPRRRYVDRNDGHARAAIYERDDVVERSANAAGVLCLFLLVQLRF